MRSLVAHLIQFLFMDYSKQIETFKDGVIGIRITKENRHDIKGIFEALKNAPTPKKPEVKN